MARWSLPIRLAGLGVCAAAACWVHWLVHGEHVDDGTGLALTGAVAAGLALALVGSVRAATRSFAREDGGAAGHRLAALLPPLALLLIGALFAQESAVDASVAMEALVEAGRTQPAALTLGPGGGDVRLAGEITEGLADRLARLLAANPRVARIHLTSEGGLADEGQALGDVIAARGLITFVPDYCVSACTLAFARGRERLIMDDARLGYHAPYEQGLFGALYRDDAGGQRAAYLAAGIAPGFVEHALSVEPADIWFPTRAELLAAGAATRVVDHDTLPDSNLDGAATAAGARAVALQAIPLLRVVATRRPAAMATIAERYLQGYARGQTEGEDIRDLRLMARGVVASALAHADDGVMRDLGRLLLRALERSDDPTACARIAEEGDLVEAASQGEAIGAAGLLDRALRSDVAAAATTSAATTSATAARGAAMPIAPSCADRRRDLAAALTKPGGTAVLRARLSAPIQRSQASLAAPASLPPTPPAGAPRG